MSYLTVNEKRERQRNKPIKQTKRDFRFCKTGRTFDFHSNFRLNKRVFKSSDYISKTNNMETKKRGLGKGNRLNPASHRRVRGLRKSRSFKILKRKISDFQRVKIKSFSFQGKRNYELDSDWGNLFLFNSFISLFIDYGILVAS